MVSDRRCGSESTSDRRLSGNYLSGGETGLSVLGDTVNVAARLQSSAEPGAVLLSEAAYQAQSRAWSKRPSPANTSSQGPSRPRTESIGSRRSLGKASQFEASLSRGLTAFVGRDRELDVLERQLRSRWAPVSRSSTSSAIRDRQDPSHARVSRARSATSRMDADRQLHVGRPEHAVSSLHRHRAWRFPYRALATT